MASYIEGHKASGIKSGDIVKVTRAASSRELGWCDFWVKDMDDFVGKDFTVEHDGEVAGFVLRCNSLWRYFPYFVLEKVK